ncbi:MAG: MFS transporter [Lachnospiraceae bacterium]
MSTNKKFAEKAFIFCILGVVMMFFYSGFQNDHLNILRPVALEVFGFNETTADMPVTVAGFAVVVFYLICGAAFVKSGVLKILVPSTVALGLATIVLGFSTQSGNLMLYNISLFFVRLLVVPLQMGGFMLCANWFIKYRGRVMGIITAGSPLFSIVGISILTKVYTSLGSISMAYTVFGVVIVALAICIVVFLKDKPEDLGMYPDGADSPPKSEAEEGNEDVSLKEILTSKVAWQLIISYGIMQFVINAMMAYMVARYMMLSPDPANPMALWMKAVVYLSVGAALGIPMSYVLGWIDDKLGTIKASLLLNILFFIAVIPLAIMPVGGNGLLMGVWAFGVACMTGGVPTMHPCSVSYVYGRKKYQGANKWIMTIQAIIMAFALYYMGFFFERGMADMAYYGMLIMLVISLITIITMWKVPDANAADRDYKNK